MLFLFAASVAEKMQESKEFKDLQDVHTKIHDFMVSKKTEAGGSHKKVIFILGELHKFPNYAFIVACMVDIGKKLGINLYSDEDIGAHDVTIKAEGIARFNIDAFTEQSLKGDFSQIKAKFGEAGVALAKEYAKQQKHEREDLPESDSEKVDSMREALMVDRAIEKNADQIIVVGNDHLEPMLKLFKSSSDDFLVCPINVNAILKQKSPNILELKLAPFFENHKDAEDKDKAIKVILAIKVPKDAMLFAASKITGNPKLYDEEVRKVIDSQSDSYKWAGGMFDRDDKGDPLKTRNTLEPEEIVRRYFPKD